MNSNDFVVGLVEHVHRAAVEDTVSALERPPGRQPPRRAVELSNWYAALSDQDRSNLRSIVQTSVHAAVFGLLCTFDGARSFGQHPNHEFHLLSVEGGVVTRLNETQGESVHDIYQGLVYSHVFASGAMPGGKGAA